MSASVESVDQMLEIYLHGGEYGHKEYHPVGNFVSGILDVTIIKPFIESIYGYDLITGEKLTDFERGMSAFVKEIQDFSMELDYDADTIVAELAEHGNTNGDISVNFIHIKNFIHKNTNRRYIQT